MGGGEESPESFGGSKKVFRLGTDRLCDPAETFHRYWGLAPAMGITRVANVTGLDTIRLPVFMVCRPNSRSLAVAQGKGLTPEAAKASGLMESIEGYHAELVEKPLRLASLEELSALERVVDVTGLARPMESRFHARLRTLWIESTDLITQKSVWVPYESVHTDFTVPSHTGSGCFISSSNGLASGNHILEAISHGLCELVERDAITVWTVRSDQERAETVLDLDSVDDPTCIEVLERLRSAGVAVAVWEVTSDIGLPVFLATIVEANQPAGRSMIAASGSGCHPRRGIALSRALTEAIQGRLTFIAGSRDDCFPSSYSVRSNFYSINRMIAQVESARPVRRYAQAPSFEFEYLEEDVTHELTRIASAGFTEILAVDLTKPYFGIPVVKVIVPGLEGYHKSPGYLLGDRGRQVQQRASGQQ